jgi:hypothetical protein
MSHKTQVIPMRSDAEYMGTDPFLGDEADLTCRTVAIRTARKTHVCYGLDGGRAHSIKAGQRYRHERARVDGDFWGEYRMCLECMDRLIDGDDSGNDDDDLDEVAP